MLELAGGMNGELRAAFVRYGRGDFRAKPSSFFPGIHPSLDRRILKLERQLENDVEFLTELADCAQGAAQDGFFDRWVNDSRDAAREWVRLPAWQRPLQHRCTATVCITNPAKNKPCEDVEAHQIWESFKYLRGQLLGTTDLRNRAPRRRQTEHPESVGTFFQHFARLAFKDRPRWREVYWNYGYMLAHSKGGGDMAGPPWGKTVTK